MKIVLYDDYRVGLLRNDEVVDVQDVVKPWLARLRSLQSKD